MMGDDEGILGASRRKRKRGRKSGIPAGGCQVFL